MNYRNWTTGVLLAGLLIPAATAQRDFSGVEIAVTDVAPGLLMLVGSGGNIGVSYGEDGVFLVDDQFAPLTEKIVAAIRSRTDAPLRFVLNTHHHGDHTGGNENLGELGALIVAHQNVRTRMSVSSPEGALPVITFSDAMTFYWNGDVIGVKHHARAHTSGDAIVHFRQANVVHMGDTFFNGLYPFIDVFDGGSIDGMIEAADAVLAVTDADTQIIPGHGPLANAADLATYRSVLAQVRSRVAAQIAEGKSQAEVQASGVTAEWDAEWGGGFMSPDRFIGLVYQSLADSP